MAEFFYSGQVVDLILALVILEGGLLALYHRFTGKGLALGDIAGFLLSGLFLLLALRAALTDAWWGWISLWLTASLATHIADLWRRWNRQSSRTEP
ncbi:hypothetical protein [Thiorhodococcus minor]|uniref:Uncharacterized protein n=1 Tax=Thiorhodococcus minor TaxID=57489 RepID=A0A6M0K7A0_9GAMM|nr:hypothetical protein [Thiorhodococcus minor]NEV64235.1 hypothetical protein [Thiorhodococcus minor]